LRRAHSSVRGRTSVEFGPSDAVDVHRASAAFLSASGHGCASLYAVIFEACPATALITRRGCRDRDSEWPAPSTTRTRARPAPGKRMTRLRRTQQIKAALTIRQGMPLSLRLRQKLIRSHEASRSEVMPLTGMERRAGRCSLNDRCRSGRATAAARKVLRLGISQAGAAAPCHFGIGVRGCSASTIQRPARVLPVGNRPRKSPNHC